MIEQVHQHIVRELDTNTRTDRIFVLTAIVLNLLVLAVNSTIAGEADEIIVLFVFVALVVVVNVAAELGLIKGRQMRVKLLEGLMRMYEDHDVAKYYDRSIVEDYRTRYNLFMLAVLATGLVAVFVPFVLLSVF